MPEPFVCCSTFSNQLATAYEARDCSLNSIIDKTATPRSQATTLTSDSTDPLMDVLVEERITFLYRDRDKTTRVSGIYGGLQITERGALRLLVHRRWGDYSYDVRAISQVKKGKAATPFADATRIGAPTAKAVERAERYEASPVQQDVYECWHCGKLFTPGSPGGTPVCRCRGARGC